MRLRLIYLFLCLVVATVSEAQDSKDVTTTETILENLDGYPCPESEFTCITLTMPVDHFDRSVEGTIDVVFGVRPADGERYGMWVLAMGGPGGSGLSVADTYYLPYFASDLLEHLDIVFFDQRGVKASGDIECLKALTNEYEDAGDTVTPQGERNFIRAMEEFAGNCVEEAGHTDLIPYLGTDQVVEDLEFFRQAMGVEKFYLHGESYGTQVAQSYAAKYPEHLSGLILDGTVDMTLTGIEFLTRQTQAFNDVLRLTLEACNADVTCAADFDGDAVAFYDDLASRLAVEDIGFSFPLPFGEHEKRSFTAIDLESTVSSSLYGVADRMLLVRALAAAAQDDMIPLARLSYALLLYDPVTLEVLIDPTASDAMYYGVTCADYSYFNGTPPERARTYLQAGDKLDAQFPYMNDGFYGDFPCVFWPSTPPAERPEPLAAEGIPTLVLGATADPATPVGMGEEVFRHLDNGYLITAEGGDHVIFGRGNSCPDNIVTAFLVGGKLPKEREIRCENQLMAEYVPISTGGASQFAGVNQALGATYNEIYYLPEYYYWDVVKTIVVGCPYGGSMTFSPTTSGAEFTFKSCLFFSGFAMTGTGTHNFFSNGRFTMDVTGEGFYEGEFKYERGAGESEPLVGEFARVNPDLAG